MKKTLEMQAELFTNPMNDSELEQVLGGGNGVFYSISHECYMNTWQRLFGCCKK